MVSDFVSTGTGSMGQFTSQTNQENLTSTNMSYQDNPRETQQEYFGQNSKAYTGGCNPYSYPHLSDRDYCNCRRCPCCGKIIRSGWRWQLYPSWDGTYESCSNDKHMNGEIKRYNTSDTY